MAFAYKILTDFSADILADFAAEQEISFVPMSYTIGEEVFDCDHVETQEERKRFYTAQRNGVDTKTSQTSVQNCIDTFTEYAKQGIDILHIALSSGLSGSFSSASIAAQEVMDEYPEVKIEVIDSLSATGGMGMLIEHATINRAAGMSLAENAAWLEENKLRVLHWFMVDDLMFLKKGGRLSTASALIGTALNIKPLLKIEADGTLSVYAKKRSAKLAMATIVQNYSEASEKPEGEIVYIIHSDNDDAANYLETEVLKLNPTAKTRIVQLCPLIGSHTGPGMCAVVTLGNPELERK